MGKALSFSFLLVLLSLLSISLAIGSTEHVYINGKVLKLGEESINISGTEYKLAKGFKLVKHVKKGDSIYEEPANLKELGVGKHVSAKVLGGVIYEIIIETYK